MSRLLAFALFVTLATMPADSASFSRHARSYSPPTDPTPSDITAMLQAIVIHIKSGTALTTDNLLLDKFVSLIKDVAPGNLTTQELLVFAGNVVKSLGGATKTPKESRDKIIAAVTVGLKTATPDLDGVIREVGRNAGLFGDGSTSSLASVSKVLLTLMPGDEATGTLSNTASYMFDLNSILAGFGLSPASVMGLAHGGNSSTRVNALSNLLGAGGNLSGSIMGSTPGVTGSGLTNLMGRFGLGFKQDAGVGSPGGGGFDFTKLLAAAAKGSSNGGPGGSAPGGGSVNLLKLVGALGGQGKQSGGGGGGGQEGGGSNLLSLVGSMFGSNNGAAAGGLDLEGMFTNVLSSQAWRGRG